MEDGGILSFHPCGDDVRAGATPAGAERPVVVFSGRDNFIFGVIVSVGGDECEVVGGGDAVRRIVVPGGVGMAGHGFWEGKRAVNLTRVCGCGREGQEECAGGAMNTPSPRLWRDKGLFFDNLFK